MALVVLAAALSPVSPAQVAEPEPQPVFPKHKLATDGTEKPATTLRPLDRRDATGYVRSSFDAMKLRITWRYEVEGYTQGAFPDNPALVARTQSIDLSFHPTDVACADDGTLLVAGIASPDVVVLYEWKLRRLPSSELGLSQSGTPRVPSLQGTFERRLVLRQSYAKDGYIGVVFRNWSSPRDPFLVFTESQRIVRLNLDSLEMKPVAGRTSESPLIIPELSHLVARGGFDSMRSGVHSDLGNVYWLYSWNRSDLPIIALYDGDKDGSIERYESIGEGEWGSSGLCRLSKFERVR